MIVNVHSTPLNVEFGDILELICNDNKSNLFIQVWHNLVAWIKYLIMNTHISGLHTCTHTHTLEHKNLPGLSPGTPWPAATYAYICAHAPHTFICIPHTQIDRIQYDSCNASAGSGVFSYNGICFPWNPIMLTFKENSQDLTNTVNFMHNQVYFLTSRYFIFYSLACLISSFLKGYSGGEFRANDATFTSGGQCEGGVKMMIVIGDVEVPTVGGNGPGDYPHSPDPTSPNNQGCELIIITPPELIII